MQVFVKMQVFETFNDDNEEHIKKVFGNQLQSILNSGKVMHSGIFADNFGCFFLLDINSTDELSKLLGPSVLYDMHLEIHPIMPLDKLPESMEKNWAD